MKTLTILTLLLTSVSSFAGLSSQLECEIDAKTNATINYNSKQYSYSGATHVRVNGSYTDQACELLELSSQECTEGYQYKIYPDQKWPIQEDSITFVETYYRDENTQQEVITKEIFKVSLSDLEVSKVGDTLEATMTFEETTTATSQTEIEKSSLKCNVIEIDRD